MSRKFPILGILLIIGAYLYSVKGEYSFQKNHILLKDAAAKVGIEYDCSSAEQPLEALDTFAGRLYERSGNPVENVMFKSAMLALKKYDSKELKDEKDYRHALDILVQTEKYIQQYDVHLREIEGCDYELIKARVPDAEAVTKAAEALKERLRNVDRKRALAGIFLKICGTQEMSHENHVKLLRHLQMISYHGKSFDMLDFDGEMIVDPLILLDTHFMKCGQISRLACDFADAIGIRSRLCQLGGHIISELYYADSWHVFDADLFSYGNYVEMDGEIPSLEGLAPNCYSVDSGNLTREFFLKSDGMDFSPQYFSYCYFSKKAYGAVGAPVYYEKTAKDVECLNKYYGWNYYNTLKNEMELNAGLYYYPSPPYIDSVEVTGKRVGISWSCEDFDEDIIGYKIYVSRYSRGWNYGTYNAEEDVWKYITDLYTPHQWGKVGTIPNNSIVYESSNPYIELDLEEGIFFISVCAVDAHSREIGLDRGLLSNELRILVK